MFASTLAYNRKRTGEFTLDGRRFLLRRVGSKPHLVLGNKVVAAALTAVSNPLTSLPLYSLAYLVGHVLIGGEDTLPDFATVHSIQAFLALGPHFFFTMLLGTTLIGAVGAVVVYFSSNRLLAAPGRWHEHRDGGRVHADGGPTSEPVSSTAIFTVRRTTRAQC